MKRIVLSFAWVASLAVGASAQAVPETVSFTARISENGSPVDGSHDFEFRLFDQDSGGTPLWEESATLDVDAGLLFHALGESTALDAALLDGRPLFLELAIDGGDPLTPRLSIVSVPYAVRAGVAAVCDDLSGGEQDGEIGNEVTNAANTTLLRSGSGTSADPYGLALNLGKANTWSADQTFSTGASFPASGRWAMDGSVGVGVTTPSARLEVAGTAIIGHDTTLISNEILKVGGGTDMQPEILVAGSSDGGADDDIYAGLGVDGSGGEDYGWVGSVSSGEAFRIRAAGINRVYLSSAGLVGIGNQAPRDALEVTGQARVTACLKRDDGTGIAGVCPSDERLKKEIRPFEPLLGGLRKLEPVHFKWRADEFPDRGFGTTEVAGLIAQDVEGIFPELVKSDAAGYRSVDYTALPLYVLQGVRETAARQDAEDARLRKLERENVELKRRLTEMEARLDAPGAETSGPTRGPLSSLGASAALLLFGLGAVVLIRRRAA